MYEYSAHYSLDASSHLSCLLGLGQHLMQERFWPGTPLAFAQCLGPPWTNHRGAQQWLMYCFVTASPLVLVITGCVLMVLMFNGCALTFWFSHVRNP
jgi:hypothetical protein